MANIHEKAWVAPNAVIQGDVNLAEGVSIWYNAVLRADQETITVGKNSNIQDCCVIHGDADNHVTVGENVTVGHGAILHGCTVEDNSLIGMGAVVLDHAVVGTGSIVGAGSVVPVGMEIPPRSLVVGVPAKVKKTLDDTAETKILKSMQEYLKLTEMVKKSHQA